MMKWIDGRQGGGYKKLPIIRCRFFDCWLIKYNAGFELPIHCDEIVGFVHHRLNILIYGEDAYIGESDWKVWRVTKFVSSLPHGTTKLSRPRLILSFGWKRK